MNQRQAIKRAIADLLNPDFIDQDIRGAILGMAKQMLADDGDGKKHSDNELGRSLRKELAQLCDNLAWQAEKIGE